MITKGGLIVRNSQGRMVGTIENKVYIKRVVGSKHMLRKPVGWGIDADVFDKIIAHQCNAIHIIDSETGKKYISGVHNFRDHRVVINRNFGRQYVLELVHWYVK